MQLMTFFTQHPWFHTWIAALVAVLASLLAYRIGIALLLRVTRKAPTLHSMVDYSRSAARWAIPLMAVQAVWQAAPDSLPAIDGARHLTGLLIIATLTWLLLRMVAGLLEGVLKAHPADDPDNFHARTIATQARVLTRSAMVIIGIIGAAMMLLTFPGARQVGTSLLASAGLFGIVAGLATKPLFSNLVAGLQIALTQPIRIDDVLVVEGEWGRVHEITGSYVVLRIWDDRNLILPLTYFIEKPFYNWTRDSARLLGSVFFYVDYTMPIADLRTAVEGIVKAAPQWDGRFFNLVVTDTTERCMQVRVLCTAANSDLAFDLRCLIREKMIDYMQQHHPQSLPRLRFEGTADVSAAPAGAGAAGLSPAPGAGFGGLQPQPAN